MKLLGPLFLLLISSCGPANKQPSASTGSEAQKVAAHALSDPNGWVLSSDTDKMDKTPEVMLFKRAQDLSEGLLTIRCSHRKTELVVRPGEIIDSGVVRIKLDDSTPLRQTWNQATNYQGLFAPDPIALARQLARTDTFLFEYLPFQQRPHTVEFKVGGLADKLNAVADACEWVRLDEAKHHAQEAAKLEAERTRKREVMLRQAISKHVEPCRTVREKGYWCWYDEGDPAYKNGGPPASSQERALADAIEAAKAGVVFKRELSQIDAQLR